MPEKLIEKKLLNFHIASEHGTVTASKNLLGITKWLQGLASLTSTNLNLAVIGENGTTNGHENNRHINLSDIRHVERSMTWDKAEILTITADEGVYILRLTEAERFKAAIELAAVQKLAKPEHMIGIETASAVQPTNDNIQIPQIPAQYPPTREAFNQLVPCKRCGHPISRNAMVCPECNNAPVENPSLHTADEQTTLAMEVPRVGALHNCSACGNPVATSAISCPKCGASNSFVHPKIASFLENPVTTRHKFTYTSTGVTVEGATEPENVKAFKWLVGVSGISLLLVIFPIFGSIGFLLFLGSMGLLMYLMFQGQGPSHMFKIDYSSDPPKWTSTDDDLWADVKAHFTS